MAKFDPLKHFDGLSEEEKQPVRERLKAHGLSSSPLCCACYILGASDANNIAADESDNDDTADNGTATAPSAKAKSGARATSKFRKMMNAKMASTGVTAKDESGVFSKMRGKARAARGGK